MDTLGALANATLHLAIAKAACLIKYSESEPPSNFSSRCSRLGSLASGSPINSSVGSVRLSRYHSSLLGCRSYSAHVARLPNSYSAASDRLAFPSHSTILITHLRYILGPSGQAGLDPLPQAC